MVGLVGVWWFEMGAGMIAVMEDVGMVDFKRGGGCLRRWEA